MSPRAEDRSVVILDRQRRRRIPRAPIERMILAAASSLRAPAGEVVVVLAGDGLLRRLNRVYRGKDRPTDVLSFAQDVRDGETLGDIAISVPTAERQARRAGHSLSREIGILALHGLLHLLGYDHEVDDGEMSRVEARLRRRLGLLSGTAR